MTEWQTIETAPKDGTAILLTGETKYGTFVHAIAQWEENRFEGWPWLGIEPTDWMKIDPPKEEVSSNELEASAHSDS